MTGYDVMNHSPTSGYRGRIYVRKGLRETGGLIITNDGYCFYVFLFFETEDFLVKKRNWLTQNQMLSKQ